MTVDSAIRVRGLEKSLLCWREWNNADSSTWKGGLPRRDPRAR